MTSEFLSQNIPAGLSIENSPEGVLITKEAASAQTPILGFLVLAVMYLFPLYFCWIGVKNQEWMFFGVGLLFVLILMGITYLLIVIMTNSNYLFLARDSVGIDSGPLPLFPSKVVPLQDVIHFRLQFLEDKATAGEDGTRFEEISEEEWKQSISGRKKMINILCVDKFGQVNLLASQVMFPKDEQIFFICQYLNHYYFGSSPF